MKRIWSVFLIVLMAGCGNQNAVESNGNENNTTLSSDTAAETTQTDQSAPKDFEAIGFALMESETIGELKLGLTTDEVIALLGQPGKVSENEYWEADGAYHRTYSYPDLGIELDLAGEESEIKVVNMILAAQPCSLETSKGIVLGNNYTDVDQAYEGYLNPEFSDTQTLVAGSIYGGVVFSFEDGILQTIFVGASAE